MLIRYGQDKGSPEDGAGRFGLEFELDALSGQHRDAIVELRGAVGRQVKLFGHLGRHRFLRSIECPFVN